MKSLTGFLKNRNTRICYYFETIWILSTSCLINTTKTICSSCIAICCITTLRCDDWEFLLNICICICSKVWTSGWATCFIKITNSIFTSLSLNSCQPHFYKILSAFITLLTIITCSFTRWYTNSLVRLSFICFRYFYSIK